MTTLSRDLGLAALGLLTLSTGACSGVEESPLGAPLSRHPRLPFTEDPEPDAGNPIHASDQWYADPEGVVFGETFWIFPTTSARYDDQTHFDAFSSSDLVSWERHERVLSSHDIEWAHRAMWAPSVVENDGRYFLFFSANDLQRPGGPLYDPNDPDNHAGGIGVAVASRPEGPYQDHLGHALIADFYNDAQPIDQFVFEADGVWYIVYGGWRRCNIGQLDDSFTRLKPFPDGETFKDITPDGYVEGPTMFERGGLWYFLWSEGSWGNDTYHVVYATGPSPLGPWQRQGTILRSDETIATGAGHNSVVRAPGTDDWYIIYHRRPIPNQGRDHRVTCVDEMRFDGNGRILPVQMTWSGPDRNPIGKN